MKRKNLIGCSVMVTVLITLMVLPPVFAASKKLPGIIGLTTYGSGSKGYAIAMGVAHAIEKNAGIKTRIIPAATKPRAIAVNRKEVVLGVQYEAEFYEMQGGIWTFQKDGPMDFALAWNGYKGNTTLMWRGDSGIENPETDLKGKRVPYYGDYSPGQQMLVDGKLAFFGIGRDDVRWVPGATYVKGMQMVIDGKADIAYVSASASAVNELASSIHGAVLSDLPASNEAGWARAKAVCPIAGPGKIDIGYSASPEHPKEWMTYPGYYQTRFDTDENLIYTLVKAIYEGYDIYKGSHPEAPRWNIDSALDLDTLNSTGLPYHSGAVKLFKEIGRWTDAHEKWQQSRLEFRTKVQEAYKQALEAAKAQKIKRTDEKFAKLWTPQYRKMRAELAAKKY